MHCALCIQKSLAFFARAVYNSGMDWTKFEKQDFAKLYDFMRPLWHDTYKEILSTEHIDFLIDKYFSPLHITAFRKQGYRYYKLENENGLCGVLVFVLRETGVFMDKLYLAPTARGKGYATAAFALMSSVHPTVTLNVNQANARALRCYQKNGFQIIAEEKITFGDNMVNVDYIMQKKNLG